MLYYITYNGNGRMSGVHRDVATVTAMKDFYRRDICYVYLSKEWGSAVRRRNKKIYEMAKRFIRMCNTKTVKIAMIVFARTYAKVQARRQLPPHVGENIRLFLNGFANILRTKVLTVDDIWWHYNSSPVEHTDEVVNSTGNR